MDIQELYANSHRLAAQVSLRHKRYLYHQLPWNTRMIGIRGARGVGKTTLLLQRMAETVHQPDVKALYVSLDELWFTQHRLIELADYHYTHGGTHLFVDEVHRYPQQHWIQEMKNIYDRYAGFHVVFTGSSVLEIDLSQADLSRRCLFFTLEGLSLREHLALAHDIALEPVSLDDVMANHIDVAMTIARELRVLQYLGEYLRYGYYPFYQELGEGYAMALRQMVVNIVEQDIPHAEAVEPITLNRVKRLVSLIAAESPFTVNVSRLAALLDCDRQMVHQLLHIAWRARLFNLIYKGRDNMQQLVKPEKVYVENTNLMYALADNVEVGTVRETFFANQLLSAGHRLTFSGTGDFLVDDTHTIEVGGRCKSFAQIKDVPGSYLAVDDVEIGNGNRIPLWMFGFLY